MAYRNYSVNFHYYYIIIVIFAIFSCENNKASQRTYFSWDWKGKLWSLGQWWEGSDWGRDGDDFAEEETGYAMAQGLKEHNIDKFEVVVSQAELV